MCLVGVSSMCVSAASWGWAGSNCAVLNYQHLSSSPFSDCTVPIPPPLLSSVIFLSTMKDVNKTALLEF